MRTNGVQARASLPPLVSSDDPGSVSFGALRLMSEHAVLPPRVEGLRRALTEGIPIVGDQRQGRAELSGMPLGDLLTIYINWMARLPQQRPRSVRFAKGFWTATAERMRPAVTALENVVSRGEALTPFLSDRAAAEGYAPKCGRKRRGIPWADKDFALNVWGAHHLHLGSPGAGDRVQRSSDLLYVRFSRDDALFLHVGNHKSFDNGSLEAAISAQTADEGRLTLKGVTGLSRQYSPQERAHLARHGVMTLAQIGDRFVISGSASSAGSSLDATRLASRIEEALLDFDPRLDDPGFLSLIVSKTGRRASDEEWRWVMHHTDLCFGQEDNPELILVVPGPF